MGAIGGFTFPFAFFIVAASMSAADATLKDFGAVAFLGLCALPFGVLGGWIFWRMAIRPASLPASVVSEVFD